VLFVGPGGFATIQAAVDAAAEGDIIRIAPGTYDVFRAQKGLSILADQPGTVTIMRTTATGLATAINLAPDKQLRLCDLVFDQNPALGVTFVQISGGISSIEGCTFRAGNFPMLQVAGFATAVMRHCTLSDGSCTMFLSSSSHLSATECTFTSGAMVPRSSFDAALLVQDSSAHLASCTITGPAAPAGVLVLAGGSGIRTTLGALWLVDCAVTGGNSATATVPAGPAITNLGAPVRHHRCTLTGGTGPGGTAPAISGASQPGPLLGVTSAPQVLQLGSTWAMQFASEPANPVFALATFAVEEPVATGIVEQPSLGFLAPAGITVAFGIADPQGHLPVSVPVPATASLLHLGVWFRGVDTFAFPLQASPVVGGVIR
jgi:hypothetical protein